MDGGTKGGIAMCVRELEHTLTEAILDLSGWDYVIAKRYLMKFVHYLETVEAVTPDGEARRWQLVLPEDACRDISNFMVGR